MNKWFKLTLILLLISGIGYSQAVSAWKGWIAGQSDADVTETEAEALDELSDAIDGITTAEADALNVVADAFDGMSAAEADAINELADAIDGISTAEADIIYTLAGSEDLPVAATIGSAYIYRVGGTDVADADVVDDLTIVSTTAFINTANAGTSPIGTSVAVEYGDGYNHITVLTLTDFIIGAPNAGNNLAIGNIMYTFPAGVQVIGFMEYNIALTVGTQTDDTPEIGIGSVIGSGVIATLDNGTMEDYVLSNAWGTTLDGAAAEVLGPVGASAGIFTGIALNQSGGTKDVCLNAADGWHASVTGNLTATGTVTITWQTIE